MSKQMATPERWAPVPGYEGAYEVSDAGHVRSLDRILHDGRRWNGRMMRAVADTGGRPTVNLRGPSGLHRRFVHHLVLEGFVGPCPEGQEALHWDDDKTNNALPNLRWGTRLENMRDRIRNGRDGNRAKSLCPRGHRLEDPNLVPSVKRRGHRSCRACAQTWAVAQRRGTSFDVSESNRRYGALLASGEKR